MSSFVYMDGMFVLLKEFFRDGVSNEEYIFIAWEFVVEVEVLDVNAACSCVWGQHDVVEEAFDGDQ
jgi:hypothetical protein